MPNDPKPLAGYETHLSYCLNASTSIVPVDEWKLAVAELDILRDDARRWRRLRKRFFDDLGTPEELREVTPINDGIMQRIGRDRADAKAYRFSCEQNSKALRHIVRDIETGRRETERTTKGTT